jgi:two-component system phosphate regulon response regulator PhoB
MTDCVLVVDDEADILQTLEYVLGREGFDVRKAATGMEAVAGAALEPPPSIVVLDLMLPDLSGIEVCRRLRSDPRTREVPVLMLTARNDEIDRVVGFEVGADDYMGKPFSVRELVLRVRALLRRSRAVPAAPGPDPVGATVFGRLRLDADGHRAWVDGTEIVLTALEFRLVSTFLARRGRVQSRDVLLEDVWGVSGDLWTRTVDTHVKRLRQKLGPAGAYLETLRGVGYRWKDRPDAG